MRFVRTVFLIMVFLVAPFYSYAEVIDPEKKMLEVGYQSVKLGDDGKTNFYTYTERAAQPRLNVLQSGIAALPKDEQVLKTCDFLRGGIKARLVEQTGMSFDVVVENYGNSGSTIACTVKYIRENQVGTQLIYAKKGRLGMYMYFVTN